MPCIAENHDTPLTEIFKVAGIIIQDKKLLVVRKFSEDYFVLPGGKPEANEGSTATLTRELREELKMSFDFHCFRKFGNYRSISADPGKPSITLSAFLVLNWNSKLEASAEIAEIRWISRESFPDTPLGSILLNRILPELISKGLI